VEFPDHLIADVEGRYIGCLLQDPGGWDRDTELVRREQACKRFAEGPIDIDCRRPGEESLELL